MAWNLLQETCYQELRDTLYSTEDELKRFRQLVVNTVLATDIMDKELKAARNLRWEKAFSESAVEQIMAADTDDKNITRALSVNRKATIVIEHLIQASDVAHTMRTFGYIYFGTNGLFIVFVFCCFLCGHTRHS